MKARWKVALGVVGAGLFAVATAFQLSRTRYEEPDYETLASGAFEVRRYGPRVVAQTRVARGDDGATSEGFRRLAGYIFGGNQGERSISMTTPVETEPVTIAMTTPVERTARDGETVVTFTMPSEHELDALPAPNDPRVELRELPGRTVAVLRFSGRVDGDSWRSRQRELERLLDESDYERVGEATLAQFDPPWVLGPFRRNEVHIPVRAAS